MSPQLRCVDPLGGFAPQTPQDIFRSMEKGLCLLCSESAQRGQFIFRSVLSEICPGAPIPIGAVGRIAFDPMQKRVNGIEHRLTFVTLHDLMRGGPVRSRLESILRNQIERRVCFGFGWHPFAP